MKLLVTTQIVDKTDSNLGFFHTWLTELAKKVDSLTVICLQKREYNLPSNVKVLSLGKESGAGKVKRGLNFYKYIWTERKNYEAVFVHMNPEYIILGWKLWWLLGKKTLLWYTHKAVNLRLRLATMVVNKIFTASETSFRLKTKKLQVVGHGIDTDLFDLKDASAASNKKLLWVGRISPVKDLETVVLSLKKIEKDFTLDIVGEPIQKKDKEYLSVIKDLVKKLGLEYRVSFVGAKKYQDLPEIYKKHSILVHTSRTGSLDKVVLEALATGLWVISSSEAYGYFANSVDKFEPNQVDELARKIEEVLQKNSGLNIDGRASVVAKHNLKNVIDKIVGCSG